MAMFETLARVMEPTSTLKLKCDLCNHTAEWSRQEAFMRLGPDSAPYDMHRLICGPCRAADRNARRVRVWI